MATPRDIREVITKLSSDKAKTRDEGIKLLNTWLDGDRSIGFCKLLAKNSAKVGPDEIPRAETWPFIITLLTKCVSMEISGSKKRAPRLLLAKTLRSAIQCAEDSKFGGKLLLLSIIRQLFSHIWDVTKDVPSFQSEYTSILKLLIVVKEYRYQMRKRIYCSLVIFYMKKVVITISAATQFSSKEELFRFILTFYVLLENSPGDFPDNIREDLITGFVDIFSNVRDEGKISRKLMECINIYLIKDGPNLGCQTLEIHSSVQDFLTRCWLTTHDRGLKMSFIIYARVQVKLNKSFSEGSPLIEQLLDVVTKELDQDSFACTNSFWSDASKEEKVIQHNLMELAASVLYWACTEKTKKILQGKRLKMENVAVRVKDGLMKGAYLWNGTIFFLIHNYGIRLRKPLLIDWFEAACQSLQKTLVNTSNLHSCDAILWLLRALLEFSALLTLPTSTGLSKGLSLTSTEVTLIKNCWNVLWTCLLHGLPIFSNATPVVDVALTLLSNMILRDQIGTSTAPHDIWDLMVFKQKPSRSALCLFSCYFSRKSVQGELRDVLHVRRNLLKATLELINFKEAIGFDEHIIKLIPAAIFSLCAGCVPTLPISDSRDMSNLFDACEGSDHDFLADIIECSMEALSQLKSVSSVTSSVVKMESHHNIRLPQQIREPLIHDMEEYIAALVSSEEGFTSLGLADIINLCSLLCNLIYQSLFTRISGINSSHMSNMFNFVLKSLAHIVSKIEEKYNEIHGSRSVGFNSIFDASGSTLSSIQCLISCPLFNLPKERNAINCEPLQAVIQYLETILASLAKLYAISSNCTSNNNELGSSLSPSYQEFSPAGCTSQVVDMDLDIVDGFKDADTLVASGSSNFVNSLSPMQWKLKLVSVISLFYPIAPNLTWQTLFNMMKDEKDDKVAETIHYNLCKNFCGSAELLSELVRLTVNMWEKSVSMKSHCSNILSSIHSLLATRLSTSGNKIVDDKHRSEKIDSGDNLNSLGDLVNVIAETGIPDWFDRIKLIDCICSFILFDPHIAQAMVGRLLVMLQDTDYRVRLFLAKKIGVLFQTWDGHDELFHDICSNFGFDMVRASKQKVVKAKDVLICRSSILYMETALVTLAHLAFYSEEIENEAVFMICAVSALEASHREMVYALLDNLSRELHYSSRTKYLDEIIGSILSRWVACEVSLLVLVEVKDLFADLLDPKIFMQYCCPWLLPPLILRNDTPNLNLASKVACKPLSLLVKDFFAQIFAVCFAVSCGVSFDKEAGEVALQSSILHIANISEHERDELIKKNMVSIVSFLLSLSSSCVDPALPYFTKDLVVLSVRTIVDGFFEIDDSPKDAVLVDKINIFRPDRVFKFLVEMHNQITAAVHPRHKHNRLTSVESLVQIIGHRATVSSTSNYIFNILGKLINNKSLQNQCCNILSKLLDLFKVNMGKEVSHVLGEQLQFLVSTLVACCISSGHQGANMKPSAEVISLLHQLTVDANSSLSDYVKELEPFPEINCLESIRLFHEDLCKDYSSRDRFLKFVRRSSSLPHGLLFLSLKTLHQKLREIVLQQTCSELKFEESNCWNRDPEVVNAVWTLVHLCGSDETDGMGGLLADFISKVGIGDPSWVLFHLPIEANQQAFNENSKGIGFSGEISEELLVVLLRLLKKYLSDDSAKTVEMTSRTLKGILSTDRGQGALQHLDSYERSLLEVHSKGASLQVVERLLLDSRQNLCDDVSLEDSSLWTTVGKTYDSWVCLLVNSLAGFCNDIILRLCKDIVLLKSEVAELLFANVLMDLAGVNLDFCQQISVKVQEHIFSETNSLLKSIQILLNAMNSLRTFYVTEKAKFTPSQSRTGKPSSNAKSRGTSEKLKERSQNRMSLISSWEKVYWLSIDYLIVAKAAIRCGSYFTAIMYVEHWCEEQFNNLTLGGPDFSHEEQLPQHIELLVASVTQINEPDSIYGIVQSHKLTSQLIAYEHEENWSKALDYYDLLVRYPAINQNSDISGSSSSAFPRFNPDEGKMNNWRYYKGLMRSLQKTGCVHVLDTYCHGLTSQINHLQHDSEFTELQYEAAWRAGNWDFSVLNDESDSLHSRQCNSQFNEELHSCLRAFQEGDASEFNVKLTDSKKELVLSISNASRESTQYIYSSIIKLQIMDHLGMAWDLRWKPYESHKQTSYLEQNKKNSEPIIPRIVQLESLDSDWDFILRHTQLHLNLLEPFIASRRVMLQILGCKESMTKHLLQSASTLRKASRFSLSTAALHELKQLFYQSELQNSHTYVLGRLEEAKVLRAQGQHEKAVSLAKYVLLNYQIGDEASNIYRLVGKWLAESRSSNARTILEQYLKRSVQLIESNKNKSNVSVHRQCQTYFQLAHYTDGLFKSYEERLASSEWQSALRLRKHKTKELDALIKRLKSSTKGEKTDYSIKIQELQKQLAMDREEAERLQDDRDSFLNLALEGYERCLSIGGKYDLRVVFRLVSLWFSLYARESVVKAMHSTVKKVQSYKFIPLVYQIASRLGSAKDAQGSNSFPFALVSLLKKMAIDHPYHTVFQLLALANGDRIKDKQRSRNSFVVDMDKKHEAENLLTELSAYHGALIQQMKQMVEIYIKLAELETKKEETNKRIPLPRDIRSIRRLELVPVVTATIPIDKSCRYEEGSFPHFNGLSDSIMVMNGINAPKVVECYGSDGCRYRQLAKSGNDDLRQDAVMEQFFGLVNTFLQNHRDTWKRKLGIRTYKVVPFTPSAGVLEWVDGTIPLGEYLLGSSRNGGAHGRYGIGDWSFLQCREHMANEKDKRKAYIRVCDNFRPVMHHFFLERFLQPSEWFESRLSYTRSVAASSMVGYIVGLGDRHSMNILIDQATAEVIHIDLGVAFEQGLMLKTPERVPFRLTRDIIDGMGVTGVEGVFRKCCEETLSVMRMNKEALLTIIEVFIHDPLYKWALSPLKALQRQKETDEDTDSNLENSQDAYEGNKDAARATLRIKQKLDGYEDGEMRSVQGQVQQLIQDAVDTDRLCQMFPGWGAWL